MGWLLPWGCRDAGLVPARRGNINRR